MMPTEPRRSLANMPSWALAAVVARSVTEAKSAAKRAKSRMFMAPHRYRFYIPRNGPGDLAIRRRCGDLAAFSIPRPGLKSRRVFFATRGARELQDTRSGLCRARPPPLEDERVIEEPDDSGNDCRIGDVEDVPGKAADVEMDEVEHRPVGDAVDRVAERAADDQPERGGDERVRRPPDPRREPDAGDDRERDEGPAAEFAILLEQPVGDAAVPDHDEVEEGAKPDRLALRQHVDEQEIELRRLIERKRRERAERAEAGRSGHAARALSHSRSASASRGVTSG